MGWPAKLVAIESASKYQDCGWNVSFSQMVFGGTAASAGGGFQIR